jgi:hypothetical protein
LRLRRSRLFAPYDPVAMRRRLLYVWPLCALALGACGGGRAKTSSTTVPRGANQTEPAIALAGRCSSSQLRLTYVGTQGATGHLEATFSLRNGSARPCSLRGYPGAQLFNAAGASLPTSVRRGNGFFPDSHLPVRTVVLEPGMSARFGLGFATNNEYVGGRPCPAASSLASVPPNAFQPLRVNLTGAGRPRIAPCGGELSASPVYAR